MPVFYIPPLHVSTSRTFQYTYFFLADALKASVEERVHPESGIPVACTLFHTQRPPEALNNPRPSPTLAYAAPAT